MKQFLRDESGATAIEYAILAAIISAALIAAIGAMGGSLNGIFGEASDGFDA